MGLKDSGSKKPFFKGREYFLADGISVCEVSWKAIAATSPTWTKLMNRPFMRAKEFHTQHRVFWWRHCAHNFSHLPSWWVEWDAFFHGDVSSFVKAFREV